jgi:2-polyprenyl-3-methyl-5-hydroxy-6-metoxy-1,4-benzoquinol methylase
MMRRTAASAILAVLLAASGLRADDQDVWNQFLAWYKAYTGSPRPPDVIRAYSATLAAEGVSQADIQERLALVTKMAATSPPELMTANFNNIYTHHLDLFSSEPTAFLVRTVRGLKPGKALDVAMGQGRNSIFLAELGWDVTGYDLSDKGLAIARAEAEKAGVRVNAVLATHKGFDFGRERWDLIVMTYAFVDMQDQEFMARVRDSLKPGGIVLVEQMNAGGAGKGPPNALFESFQGLRVLFYEDTVDTAEWSHEKARIGRIAAQKD